jgi:ATP-dependent Lon protease
VLPVGGIKAKVMAAHRAGIKRVILPHRNAPDLDDVPDEVLADLEVIFAEEMSTVLEAALDHTGEWAPSSEELNAVSRRGTPAASSR